MTSRNSFWLFFSCLFLLWHGAVSISFTKQFYVYSDIVDDAPFLVKCSPHYFGIIRNDEIQGNDLVNGSLQISLLPKFREVAYHGSLLGHGYVRLFRNEDHKKRVRNLLASGDIIMAVVPINDSDSIVHHLAAIEAFGKKLVTIQRSISSHAEFQEAGRDLKLPFMYFLSMLTVGDDHMLINVHYPMKMIHSVNHKDASIVGLPEGDVKVKSNISGRHKSLSILYGYYFVFTGRRSDNVKILRLADGGVHVEAGPKNIHLICPIRHDEVWVVLIRIHHPLSGEQAITLRNVVNFLDRRNPLQALSRIAESPLAHILSAYALPVNGKIGHSPAYLTSFVEAVSVIVARDDPESYFYQSSSEGEQTDDDESDSLELPETTILSDFDTADQAPSAEEGCDEAKSWSENIVGSDVSTANQILSSC